MPDTISTVTPRTHAAASRRSRDWGIVGAGLGLLILTNVGAAWLLPAQIDLTRGNAFTLSPRTVSQLDRLQTPISIEILAPREPRTAGERQFAQGLTLLRELLEPIRQRQPLVTIREVDTEASMEARALQQQFPEMTPPCVLLRTEIENQTRHEVLYARDLAEIRSGGAGRPPGIDFFGEATLTAALERLASGRRAMVLYALTGHGEVALEDEGSAPSHDSWSTLARRLSELNVEVRPLALRESSRVPADADLLLVPGGELPPAAEEVQALERYLANGGRAIFFCELGFSPLDGTLVPSPWHDLLARFGVLVGTDRVITRGFTGQLNAASPAQPAAGTHPLVRSLPPAPVVLYDCRSVRRLEDVSTSAWQVDPVLVSSSSPQAWAEADATSSEPSPGGANDLEGPVAMAVAVSHREGTDVAPALVVVGDAEFLSDRALESSSGRSGLSFLLSSLRWLKGASDLAGDIPVRRTEAYQLTGTPEEQRGLVWKPALLLCGLLITTGATVWISRRDG